MREYTFRGITFVVYSLGLKVPQYRGHPFERGGSV